MTPIIITASITDPLIRFATEVVGSLGLPGIFTLMFFESACIPIPSEATMLFAGFNVSKGEYSLFAITAVGSIANLAGSWLAYAVGYFGRVELLEHHARKLHIKQKHLAWADKWFAKYGRATVFFTRMLPIIRTFISLPAGVARMNFATFSLYTLLGSIPWVFTLGLIGQQVGANWKKWQSKLHYVDYLIVGIILLSVIYLIVRAQRNRRSRKKSVTA